MAACCVPTGRGPRATRPAAVIRDREEIAEQIRALHDLRALAATYGFDITRPAATGREAIQWLYLAYLAAVKEQNGAAMSLGRTSTFLDCYLAARPRRRDADRAGGAGAGRRLRPQAADGAVPARRPSTTRSSPATRPGSRSRSAAWAMTDGRSSTKTSFRYLQTLYNLGPAPEPNLTVLWSTRPAGGVQALLRAGVDRHLGDPVRVG